MRNGTTDYGAPASFKGAMDGGGWVTGISIANALASSPPWQTSGPQVAPLRVAPFGYTTVSRYSKRGPR